MIALFPAIFLALSFGAAPARADTASEICVLNDSDRPLLFAADPREGTRLLAPLAPQERLCAGDAGQGGVVSVYADAAAMEGCSRLVGPGGQDSLLRYAEFDRCAWTSNTVAR